MFRFTSLLPLTSDLITRVAELPLGPIVRWPLGKDAWAAIGLGDLVMLAVAPPVFWKSYGRTAGIVAAGTSIAAAPGALILLALVALILPALPVTAIFGPATILMYVYWRRRHPVERTTAAFRRASEAPFIKQAVR